MSPEAGMEIISTHGTVAYFAPDLADPAVHRRVAQWRHAGHEVHAFAFARDPAMGDVPGYISLGPLTHRSRLTRFIALGRALARLWHWRRTLANAQLYIARNMDNAFLALFVRKMTGSSVPVVYEVLDINGSCVGLGRSARLMRRLEKWLLSRTSLLVVSSPYYISAYYLPYFNYDGPWLLFENKVPQHACPVHSVIDQAPRSESWKIGWFGFLDDERSWRALCHLAERLPEDVMIYVRGRPYSDFDTEAFLDDIARLNNVVYGGPYKSPDDLPAIYGAVDVVWSADLNALEGNSRWLLTNATYEALYFGKPIISLSNTAVGEFVTEHDAGWCIEQPVEDALIDLFSHLSKDQYRAKCAIIAAIPRHRFVESDEIEQIFRISRPAPVHGATAPLAGTVSTGVRNSVNL
jgi:succinoglycan biosynthesis protein ExoL